MEIGVKIKAPLPISLKSVGLPHIQLHLEEEYVEVILSPLEQGEADVEIQCSSASAKKKKALKEQVQREFSKANFTMNMLWTKLSTPSFEVERRIIDHLLLFAKDFYERKGQTFTYERTKEIALDPLFLNGKFTYDRYGVSGSFPFPSGWSYAIVKGPLKHVDLPVSDQQAAILSEALYKNNPFLLHEMQTPLDLPALWGEAAPYVLTAWPMPAPNSALVVFEQSYKRETFQKILQKPYTCKPTNLDTLGIHIV